MSDVSDNPALQFTHNRAVFAVQLLALNDECFNQVIVGANLAVISLYERMGGL